MDMGKSQLFDLEYITHAFFISNGIKLICFRSFDCRL